MNNLSPSSSVDDEEKPTQVAADPQQASGKVDDRAITAKFPAQRRPRPRTIVVVDDSDDAQDFFRTSLEAAGYRVLAARNGKDALEILVEHSTPSAIIVDLFMPIMDGFELMDVLRSYTRLARVPLIVVSASDGQIAFGDDALFLKKPIQEPVLLQTVESALAGQSA
jgi:CheY-like chemotaxis protein